MSTWIHLFELTLRKIPINPVEFSIKALNQCGMVSFLKLVTFISCDFYSLPLHALPPPAKYVNSVK